MTLLHFDGFRSYADDNGTSADFNAVSTETVESQNTQWYLPQGGFSTAYSRFGSPNIGLRLPNTDYGTSAYFKYTLVNTLSPATVIVGVVFYKDNADAPSESASYPFIRISDGAGNNHLNLCWDSSDNLKAYRNTTLLGTSSGATLQDYKWHYLEVKLLIHASAGTVEVKLDGTQILDLSGQDTLEGANVYARQFQFGGVHNDLDTSFDCIWIMDNAGDAPQNDFLGDCRCDVLRPNGAGADADFTPSVGSNYENVDDVTPDDDSTYNSSDTVDHQDSYALPSLASGGTIYGVKFCICINKTDAGAKGAKILTRSNGTYYKSDEVDPSTDYETFAKVYQVNPDDSAAWAEADITGAEIGVEVSS